MTDRDFTKIKEMREEINKLLEERPSLIPFQKKIDEAMRKAGKNHHNRIVVLEEMIKERLIALRDGWKELNTENKKLSGLATNLKSQIEKEKELKK